VFLVCKNILSDMRGGAVEALRRLRKRKGLTQQELAKHAGVSQYTITEIETGRRDPRPSTLRKLANALDVEVADLFQEPRQVKLSGSSAAKSDARATLTVGVSRQLFEHLVDIARQHEPLEPEEQREVDEVLERV
jgi:transcriptional regulator with XRE-family HTH domain